MAHAKIYTPAKIFDSGRKINILAHVTHTTHVKIWPTKPADPHTHVTEMNKMNNPGINE